MIFPRLVWSSLAVALLVGTVQTGVQRWQAAPLILSAEVYQSQKAEAPAHAAADHTHAPGTATYGHPQAAAQQPVQEKTSTQDQARTGTQEWEPANGVERVGWTWVANTLHAFSMALLVFAVMGVWRYQRGATLPALPLAGWVAAAGWLSFYLWPTLGLPAEVPGMNAAPLHSRQMWWALAAGSAGMACALIGFAKGGWRWPAAAILLALPFALGAPHLQGDALAGFSPVAHAALGQLAQKFAWATTWVASSFWLSMGLACGLAFQRWLQPVLMATFTGGNLKMA